MPPDTPDPGLQGGRSRRRRNVVGRSPHRDEYVALMKAGWSSLALERYAAYRYGEDVPSRTFREYKTKQGIDAEVRPFEKVDPDQVLDVVGARAELIRLQQARISVDWKHEQAMGKLFGSTRSEVQTLNALLDAHRADLQAIGVMPVAGEKVEITTPDRPSAESAPRAKSLGALLGNASLGAEDEAAVAKVLHLAVRGRKTPQADAG